MAKKKYPVGTKKELSTNNTIPTGGYRFQSHPKKTLAVVVIGLAILTDLAAGKLLIPRNFDFFRVPHPFYHHDLRPNTAANAKWGETAYPLFTDSLGFRDTERRAVNPAADRRRLVLIGDSFLEGVGVPYELSAAGILARSLRSRGIEVLNASVVSYSPKLYYLKMLDLLENRGVACDELLVFIDISDIQNEIAYERFEPAPFPLAAKMRFHLDRFLKRTSYFYWALARLGRPRKDALDRVQDDGLFPCLADISPELLNNENFLKAEGIWTVDAALYERYGKKGLMLAEENMNKLAELCRRHNVRLRLAVYPWPAQIIGRDLNSVQVTFWESFAVRQRIELINLFPVFINAAPPQTVLDRYFIPGDVHWNASGNALVAYEVLKNLTAIQ